MLDLGFRVLNFGFWVSDREGFWVSGFGFRVERGIRFRVLGFGFRVTSRVSGFRFQVERDLGFRGSDTGSHQQRCRNRCLSRVQVSGSGFRVFSGFEQSRTSLCKVST